MTIDEAIAKYKEIANTDANCPAHCNISCDKCVQESKQLVEWLEELKMYKSLAPRELVSEKQKNERLAEYIKGFDYGFKTGYNKAIGDFVKFASDMPTVETEDGEVRPMWLEEMAEQLKAGGNIELSEYSKSQGNRTGK